jgi:hypothetical protein
VGASGRELGAMVQTYSPPQKITKMTTRHAAFIEKVDLNSDYYAVGSSNIDAE